MVYENAKLWIKKLNQEGFAGFNDWILPTRGEAMCLMEREKKENLYINSVLDSQQRWI